jgi:hypothetical protein
VPLLAGGEGLRRLGRRRRIAKRRVGARQFAPAGVGKVERGVADDDGQPGGGIIARRVDPPGAAGDS